VTRALRPVTPQEDLDANLTIDALIDVAIRPGATLDDLLVRKAELIVERATAWEDAQRRADTSVEAPDGPVHA
jgi:hypothetical protein